MPEPAEASADQPTGQPRGVWRLDVDQRSCIGSGICTGIAPMHFALVNGAARPVFELTTPTQSVVDAARTCPMEAISVHDVADGRKIAP